MGSSNEPLIDPEVTDSMRRINRVLGAADSIHETAQLVMRLARASHAPTTTELEQCADEIDRQAALVRGLVHG